MLLTGHFFFIKNDANKEALFIARCEQILSTIPNISMITSSLSNRTILRFVLSDQLNINEASLR